jgi:hypothetical protein
VFELDLEILTVAALVACWIIGLFLDHRQTLNHALKEDVIKGPALVKEEGPSLGALALCLHQVDVAGGATQGVGPAMGHELAQQVSRQPLSPAGVALQRSVK